MRSLARPLEDPLLTVGMLIEWARGAMKQARQAIRLPKDARVVRLARGTSVTERAKAGRIAGCAKAARVARHAKATTVVRRFIHAQHAG